MTNIVNLEVDGVPYENFTSLSITKSIENISGAFTFVATVDKTSNFPIKVGQSCRALIDGEPVITGFIEVLNVSGDPASHTITVQGRDKTADIVDSSLTGNVEFIAPISLKKVIERVLSLLNITDIKVIVRPGFVKDFTAEEVVSGAVSENAFDFIEKYCRKRQLLISSDGDGNIVLQRAGVLLIKTRLLNEKNGRNNNIKSYDVTYDHTDRFNKYIVKSQSATGISYGSATSSYDVGSVTNQKADNLDTEIRNTRTLEFISSSSDDSITLADRIKWEINIRKTRSLNYSVRVAGYRTEVTNGELWTPNRLVNVTDEDSNIIDTRMLIKAVTYSKDLRGGSVTDIQLVSQDSYKVLVAPDIIDERATNIGRDFVLKESRADVDIGQTLIPSLSQTPIFEF